MYRENIEKERNYARDKLNDNIYYYVLVGLEHRLKRKRKNSCDQRKIINRYRICIYGVYNYSITEEFVMVHWY